VKIKDQDVLSGALLIICALIGYFFAAQLENLSVAGLSAAFYPSFLFTALLVCGAALVWQGVKREEKTPLPAFNWGKLLATAAALALYVLCMQYAGFVLSTIGFLVLAMYIFGERRKPVFLGVPVITSVAVYYLFSKAFMIILP
jgi:putative tricarboxylic transport membrane protein